MVITEIIKRDGSKQAFDSNKIKNAMRKAFNEVPSEHISDEDLQKLTEQIVGYMILEGITNVEDIQDAVERFLMKNQYYETAKTYITYRYKHQLARDKYTELMSVVNEKLTASNVQNQNANLDENTFSGREKEALSAILKQYTLDNLVSETTKNNHSNNEVYIHDLDAYASGMHNCLSIPLDDLLAKGFKVKQTDIRPAGSINTAMQLSAVIMQLQSLCQFGGVAYTHFDWSMVPYVRKSFAKHYRDGLKYLEDKEN